MKLNREQAVRRIIRAIRNDERHPDYERVVELSRTYKKHITGTGLETDIEQYKGRETAEALAQRIRLTHVINPALSSSVMNAFYKVPKTDRVVNKINVIGGDDVTEEDRGEMINKIQKLSNLFYGSDNEEGGLDFWLKNRIIELSFIDPNCFIVIEARQDPFEGLLAYPYEVNSEAAILFDIENNNTDWLIDMQPIKYVKSYPASPEEDIVYTDGFRFTIYCGEFTIVLRQVSEEVGVNSIDVLDTEQLVPIGTKGTYAMAYYVSVLEDWQMFRVGYKRDLDTDSRTYVSPLHPSLNYFKKAVQTVSEYDITSASHVFPQKYVYTPKCAGEIKDGDVITCYSGKTRDGKMCKACNGTGAYTIKSAAEIMTIPLPDDKENMFPLKDMQYYFAPPIELIKFQEEVIDKFEPKIHQAVFNSTVLVTKTQVATATEKDQDMDSIYDTLHKFSMKLAACYLNVRYAIAKLLDYSEKVEFVYRYPSDFRMKSRSALYAERKNAVDAGVPSFALQAIDDEIAGVIYQDDTAGSIQYNIKKRFLPFKGKSREDILFALNSPITSMRNKILYMNFDEIIDEAARNTKNFFISPYDTQLKAVDEVVKKYAEENEKNTAAPRFLPISRENAIEEQGDGNNSDGEEDEES
jgi:hypothetical protein